MSMENLLALRRGELLGARRLDLYCGLTELPPEVFELADTLEVLNLTGNRLSALPDDLPVTAFRLDGANGPEYWMGLKNFYAITRYNRSVMYAMAVHQLSDLLV